MKLVWNYMKNRYLIKTILMQNYIKVICEKQYRISW